MSVVANVLCSRASWVAYDGRASRSGKIVSESTDKAVMVNNSVCVGYTGYLELAQLVVLNLREHVVGISDMKSDTVASAIELLLPKLKAPENVFSNFLVTGLNSNGFMASYTLGSNREICAHVPNSNELKISVLRSNTNTVELEPYVIKHVRESGFDSTSITNALREYIRNVSQIDASVNAHCQIIELHR